MSGRSLTQVRNSLYNGPNKTEHGGNGKDQKNYGFTSLHGNDDLRLHGRVAESEVYLTIQTIFANPGSEYYIGDAYVSDYDQLDYVAFYYNYDTQQLVLGGKEQITFWQDVEPGDGLFAIGCICQIYNYFTEMEPDTMLVIGFAGDDEEQQVWIDNAEDALAFVEMITGLVTEE